MHSFSPFCFFPLSSFLHIHVIFHDAYYLWCRRKTCMLLLWPFKWMLFWTAAGWLLFWCVARISATPYFDWLYYWIVTEEIIQIRLLFIGLVTRPSFFFAVFNRFVAPHDCLPPGANLVWCEFIAFFSQVLGNFSRYNLLLYFTLINIILVILVFRDQ